MGFGGWLLVFLVLWMPVSPTWGQAQEPMGKSTYKDARRLTSQGARLFRAADYKKARLMFEQAHALHPDPNLLYNIARCFEEEGKLDMAIEKLSQFLAESAADPAVRKKAVARLSKLQRLQSRMEAGQSKYPRTTKSDEPLPTSPAPKAGAIESRPGEMVGTLSRAERPSESTFDWSLWQWTSLGSGAVTVLAGGVVFALGEADHRKVFEAQHNDPVTSMTRAEALDLVDSGNTKKTIGYIFFGAGGAIMLGSLVLFLIEPEAQKTVKSTLISALPHNRGAMLLWSQSF